MSLLLARRPAKARAGVSGRGPWSREDLALLDEAQALIAGTAVVYGHVVVDEAQDLSAMDLRMVARRTRGRSMTILGDLAQATGPGAQTRWEDLAAHLDAGLEDGGVRVEELALGYRVPGPILDLANRLLPEIAPGVRESRSVRTTGDPPRLVAVTTDALVGAVTSEVVALTDRWNLIGVVAPESLLDPLARSLAAAGVAFADARSGGGLDVAVTLLPPLLAKGLEFDATVVVEPAAIAAGHPNGLRLLYVALTRSVQRLSIVHAEPLPDLLNGRPSP